MSFCKESHVFEMMCQQRIVPGIEDFRAEITGGRIFPTISLNNNNCTLIILNNTYQKH